MSNTPESPITVVVDPDPRGVSVGVWQGSHCIYSGAHPLPAAADASTAAHTYGAPAEVAARIEHYLTHNGQENSASLLLYEAMKALRAPAAGDARDAAPEWATCESRGPWARNSLKAVIDLLRGKETRARHAFTKDYMGLPARYIADAYGEAAALDECSAALASAPVADLRPHLEWALRRIRTSLDTGDKYEAAQAALDAAKGGPVASAPVSGELHNSDSRYAVKSSTCDAAPQASAVAGEAVCKTCGGSRVDPGGLPICRDCGPVAGEAQPEIEQMAVNRYRPVPDGKFSYKVVAGDGSRSLYTGTKDSCLRVAAKLTEAFLDGAFVASDAAPQASAENVRNGTASKRYSDIDFDGWIAMHCDCDDLTAYERKLARDAWDAAMASHQGEPVDLPRIDADRLRAIAASGSQTAMSNALLNVARALKTQADKDGGQQRAGDDLPAFMQSRMTPWGLLVRACRIVVDTTMMDMSRELGIRPSSLSSYEHGRKGLNDDFVIEVMRFFEDRGLCIPATAWRKAAIAATQPEQGERDEG